MNNRNNQRLGTGLIRGVRIQISTSANRGLGHREQLVRPGDVGWSDVETNLRQDANLWRAALLEVLRELAAGPHGTRIRAIAVDGTSGTLLLADADGEPLAPARMYNDTSGAGLAQRIAALAPPESGAHGAASPLARLLLMQQDHPGARYALHQADWLAGLLNTSSELQTK